MRIPMAGDTILAKLSLKGEPKACKVVKVSDDLTRSVAPLHMVQYEGPMGQGYGSVYTDELRWDEEKMVWRVVKRLREFGASA